MMHGKFFVGSFAALAIALSGAVFSDDYDEKEVKDPVSDPVPTHEQIA